VHASPFYIGNASYYISCLLICLLTWCVECTASVGKHYFYRRHTNETTSKGGKEQEKVKKHVEEQKKEIRVEDTSLFKCHVNIALLIVKWIVEPCIWYAVVNRILAYCEFR
jgi:hypothetical protein